MFKFAIPSILWCSMSVGSVTFADEFETKSWPGEGIPVLVALRETLTLSQYPELDAPTNPIRYRAGWRVPFDLSIYRTTKSSTVVVQNSAAIEIWCDGVVLHDFEKGDEIEYLQYMAEGSVTASVDGVVCEVPLYLEEETFGINPSEPETEWWVRVVYGDGTSPGWILVMGGQVSFDDREF